MTNNPLLVTSLLASAHRSIGVAGTMTALVASFSYFTFWENTSSDLFTIYPASKVVDSAEVRRTRGWSEATAASDHHNK